MVVQRQLQNLAVDSVVLHICHLNHETSLMQKTHQVTMLQNVQSHMQSHDYPQWPLAARTRVGAYRPGIMAGRGWPEDVQLFHQALCLNVDAHSIAYEVIKKDVTSLGLSF